MIPAIPDTATIGRAWRRWRDIFAEQGVTEPATDARRLAEHALHLSAAELALRENLHIPEAAADALSRLAERRLQGEPVARILGEQGFYGLDFALGPETLVPRPETEMLVSEALGCLAGRDRPHLLDLGTGTGCIAISLLKLRPDATAVATDISEPALETARENAARHGVADRIQFRSGGWFEPVHDLPLFDCILSNPPYISSTAIQTLQIEVRRYDPLRALDGGPDGLVPYREIAAAARAHLAKSAPLILEIGYDQRQAVTAILTQAGFHTITVRPDLAGMDRVIIAA